MDEEQKDEEEYNEAQSEAEQLANYVSHLQPTDDEGQPIEAFLTKFVLITEWMDGEGSRYATKRCTNGAGEGIPDWDINGLLFEALHGSLK